MKPTDFLVEEVWDVKKIIIGLVSVTTVATGGYFAKEYLFQNPSTSPAEKAAVPARQEVEGATTENTNENNQSQEQKKSFSIPSVNSAVAGVQQKMDTLKDQVTNLNAQEVASSSPQIQKILNDLKTLEEYPKNQAKEACYSICNNL
jgi:hypothetical protein